MEARLEVCSGKLAGEVFALGVGEHEIGTSRRAAVRIAERGVSYAHARLQVGPKGITLTDLHSTAGTQVNGQPLLKHEPRQLVPGDRIAFGPVEVSLSFEPARSASQRLAALAEVADAIAAHVMATYTPHYSLTLYFSGVEVLRPEKF